MTPEEAFAKSCMETIVSMLQQARAFIGLTSNVIDDGLGPKVTLDVRLLTDADIEALQGDCRGEKTWIRVVASSAETGANYYTISYDDRKVTIEQKLVDYLAGVGVRLATERKASEAA